jgi:hypothetical protein
MELYNWFTMDCILLNKAVLTLKSYGCSNKEVLVKIFPIHENETAIVPGLPPNLN